MNRSLRTSLILGTIGGTLVALAAGGIYLYFAFRGALLTQLEADLRERARFLASTVEVTGQGVEADLGDWDLTEFSRPSRGSFLLIEINDGPLLYHSPNLTDQDLLLIRSGRGERNLPDRLGPEQVSVRGATLVFTPRIDEDLPDEGDATTTPQVRLLLARSTAEVDAVTARLRLLMILIGAATAVVTAGVLRTVIARALRPLPRLAARIADLDENQPSARIDLPDPPAELRPILDRLNDLLGRIDLLRQRERSFSGDVAHELRTPISGLRTTLEVALRGDRSRDEYAESVTRCLEITLQLQEMIESLLMLLRLDTGQVKAEPRPVRLDDLIRKTWSSLSAEADERGLQIKWSLAPMGPVVTDPGLLDLAIANILRNAAGHSNRGGSVEVSLSEEASRPVFRVRNSGSRVDPSEAREVFERFWRGDASRSATGSHAGLGLALVRRVADVLGLDYEARSSDGWFEIALTFAEPR